MLGKYGLNDDDMNQALALSGSDYRVGQHPLPAAPAQAVVAAPAPAPNPAPMQPAPAPAAASQSPVAGALMSQAGSLVQQQQQSGIESAQPAEAADMRPPAGKQEELEKDKSKLDIGSLLAIFGI